MQKDFERTKENWVPIFFILENNFDNYFDNFQLLKSIDARVQFEEELREQLSRQAAIHSDHLAEILKLQVINLLFLLINF